jgi:hypothetical protein
VVYDRNPGGRIGRVHPHHAVGGAVALKGGGVPFLGDINPVFALIVGYLYAVFLDWGLMLFAEAFILLVRGSRDLRVNAAATTSLLNLQRSANEGRKDTP